MQETKIIKANGNVKETTPVNGEELTPDRHTEDMQEIITKVPSWILRWGIMLFFGILLMIVAISVFVRYPDTIKGGLKLESSGISASVIIPVAGSITKLLIKQGSVVKKEQPLVFVATSNNPISTYILTAPQDGRVGFVAIVQQGAFLRANQEVFTIHPNNEQFFGIMQIPSNNINKIKVGQEVLISLRNYPTDEYGQLKGNISYIADEPTQSGLFTVKVTPNTNGLKKHVELKSWMIGDAEIITENVSLQRRIYKSILKGL